MKKFLILILSVFLLCACQPKEESINYDEYLNIKKELEVCDSFDQDYDFKVSLIFNPINDQYRYDIVIDYPKCDMYDITALAYANEDDDSMCPNIGLFDVYKYHLINDFIDKKNGFYKGINLSGMCQDKTSVKLYVSYYLESDYKTKVEKYIEVFESETR